MMALTRKPVILILFAAVFLSYFFVGVGFTFAQRDLEVPLPGIGGEQGFTQTPSLLDYVKYVFNFTIGIIGIIVFCVLVYGGIRYLTSAGNPSTMADANNQIFSALLGLALLFGSWLLLTTINPDLVRLTIRVPSISGISPAPPPTPPIPPPPPGGVAAFTVNDGAAATILPGESVTLKWNSAGIAQPWGYCIARSVPLVQLWSTGNEKTSGTKQVGPLTQEGQYIFGLTCGEGGEAQVIVIVSSAPPSPSQPPTVVLKVNGYDGPNLNFPSTEIPGQDATFSWTSQNAQRCWAEWIPPSQELPNNSMRCAVYYMQSKGTVDTYTITCVNTTTGETATDTIWITTVQ